jgi:hypothetical protein
MNSERLRVSMGLVKGARVNDRTTPGRASPRTKSRSAIEPTACVVSAGTGSIPTTSWPARRSRGTSVCSQPDDPVTKIRIAAFLRRAGGLNAKMTGIQLAGGAPGWR